MIDNIRQLLISDIVQCAKDIKEICMMIKCDACPFNGMEYFFEKGYNPQNWDLDEVRHNES